MDSTRHIWQGQSQVSNNSFCIGLPHTHINIQRKSEDVSGSRTFYYRGLPIQSMDVTLYNNIYINMYIVFEYKVVQTKISVRIPIGFVSSFLVYWQWITRYAGRKKHKEENAASLWNSGLLSSRPHYIVVR